MHLLINGHAREFVEVRAFRAAHGLPDDFGVALFEPKDYTGLGRIDRAGAELNTLRQAIVAAVPTQIALSALPTYLDDLGPLFLAQLHAINRQVGLLDVEIEFAYAGFQDMCQALLYALLHAQSTHSAPPSFEQVYTNWLNNTVRVSQNVHVYAHQSRTWRVQIVNNVYGRVGLMAHVGEDTYYVRESSLACPAEGFMHTLLSEVAERLIAASHTSG
jgi:hypothetical protein